MANLHEIFDHVMNLLANEISLDDFEDWSAEYSLNIHQQANKDARNLAYQIRGILNAHEDDDSDVVLRGELAQAIFPFLEEHQVGDSSALPSMQFNVEENQSAFVG
jgi:hypothetical protein